MDNIDEEREQQLPDAATFIIIIRTRQADWDMSDEDMVHRPPHQAMALRAWICMAQITSCHQSRLFEIPTTLRCIYTLSLMVNTLIQRNVRASLKEKSWDCPVTRNKPSDTITTRFYFELFQGISSQRVRHAGKTSMAHGHNEITKLAVTALESSKDPYAPILATKIS